MHLAFLLAAGLVGGQEPTALSDVTPPTFREELLVTAAVEPVERSASSASATVIEADEIEARQATDVASLLATVAGLHVARSGGPGQLGSLFSRGTESEHTLVLLDGVPLNNPYFGGFNWAFLPTDGLERVEVVRGPYSALYGSDALGGVVQLLGSAREGGRVRLEGGSGDTLRAGLDWGRSWGDLRVDVSGHARRGDGELANSFYDGEQLRLDVRWQATPGLKLGFWARAHDADTGIPTSGAEATPHRTITWEERELGVPVTAELGDWDLDVLLSEVRYDQLYEDPDDPFGFTFGRTDSRARRGRAAASGTVGENGWMALGVEASRQEVDDRSSYGTSIDGASQSTWALFGQGRYRLGPVTLEAGVRHDDNDRYGSYTSPRLGMVLEAFDGLRVRASYGEGFRAPSLGELFYPYTGNPELRPERSHSWEAGIELARGDARLSVTAYRNDIEELIDFDFATFRNVNVVEVRTEGLELEGEWRHEALLFTGQATWLDAVDRLLDAPLLRRPDFRGGLGVTWTPPRWVVDLRALYVGDRPDVDPVTFERATNPAYVTLDLAARFRAGERWAPYARVENLTDEAYEEALGFPAPGRRLVGGVELDF